MMCSANVGGDPVNGCENEVVSGEDLCQRHLERTKAQCPYCSHLVGVTQLGRLVVHKRTRTAMQDGFQRAYRVECIGSRTEDVEG